MVRKGKLPARAEMWRQIITGIFLLLSSLHLLHNTNPRNFCIIKIRESWNRRKDYLFIPLPYSFFSLGKGYNNSQTDFTPQTQKKKNIFNNLQLIVALLIIEIKLQQLQKWKRVSLWSKTNNLLLLALGIFHPLLRIFRTDNIYYPRLSQRPRKLSHYLTSCIISH